jgi:hypothetical protein
MLYQDCKPAPFGVMPGAVQKCAVMNMHNKDETTTTTASETQPNTINQQEELCGATHMVYDHCDHYAFGMMPDEVKKSPVPMKKSPVPAGNQKKSAGKLTSWALPKLPLL